jgi:parallel beta-helix repeat protein
VFLIGLLSVTIVAGALRFQSIKADLPPTRLDNLIITASDLEAAASRLAQWKNSCGIPTRVLDVEWINSTYSGVDEPEKIRNCIKDYYNNFQIKFVTIFGDADKVPTRLVYTPDTNDDTNFTATDLYYADLNGTWDDNHDRFYADQRYDNVDGIPDLCIGRIPISLPQNAQPMVDKIIRYHQQFDPSQDWTRRVVLAAGTGNNGLEDLHGYGFELLNDFIANINQNKEIVKLYEKAGNLSTDTMKKEINRGALFVNFAGHGDPNAVPIFSVGWLFYWVIPIIWWNGFGTVDVQSTTNGARLPVVTTSSCSTARFDDAECMGEWFVGHPTGGAIAYFGSTRVSYSYPNSSAPSGLMGEMDWRIYQNFYEGFTRLGQMWRESVKEYAQLHVLNYSSAPSHDVKTIMEFVLLGDPTLRIPNGPDTLEVPSEYATIQGAINDAYDGDTIEIATGEYHENITLDKSVSLLGENKSTTILDSCSVNVLAYGATISNLTMRNNRQSCISLYDADFCNVSGNIFDSSYMGILVSNSSYNNFAYNLMRNCSYGIFLDYFSRYNLMSYNEISNGGEGIYIFNQCFDNTIWHNTMMNNYGDGLFIENSDANWIEGNNFTRNNDAGISLVQTSLNYIANNDIRYSAYGGVVLRNSSSGNTIRENKLIENEFGIVLDSSVGNSIYYNSLVHNIHQATIHPNDSAPNLWDNGYPSGGNYWSDYIGTDLYSGSFQNETGNDGIGDTAYVIDANNTDNYPLIKLFPYIHDIAVVGVGISKTVIGKGFTANLSVGVANRGHFEETLNLTLSAYVEGNPKRGTWYYAVRLGAASSSTATFAWNTSGFAEGNYTLSAGLEPVANETDTADNTFSSWIVVTIPGDIKGDFTVDIYDALLLSAAFNSKPMSPNWNPNADINCDNIVDIYDAIILANHCNQHYP